MDKEEQTHIHRPEFILLEKENAKNENGEQNDYFQALSMLQKTRFSVGLQLIMLILLLLVLFSACIVLFFFTLHLLIGTVTLFRNPSINKKINQSWQSVKKVFAFIGGFFLGVFNPSLGLGCIILYFMQEKIPLSQAVLSRFFKFGSSNYTHSN